MSSLNSMNKDELNPGVDKEEILHENCILLSGTIDDLLEGCQIISYDWKYLYLNETAARHGKHPVKYFLGRTLMEMFPGIDQTELFGVLNECMTKRTFRSMEFEFTHPDGERIWYEFRIQPVSQGIFVLSNDITGRKQNEHLMQSLEQRYRRLFEHMSEGFSLCRMIFEGDYPADFIYLDVNPKFYEQTGLRDVIGRKVTELLPGIREKDSTLFETYGQVVKTGIPQKLEYRVETMDRWFSISVYSSGSDYFVTVFDDISLRKKREFELRSSIDSLGLALEAGHGGTWEWDVSTNKNTWSDELWKVYGLEKGCCIPSYGSWLNTIHPDDREKTSASVENAFKKGIELNIEWRLITPQGLQRWVTSRGKPIFGNEGQIVKYFGVVFDITDYKQIEENLTISTKRYQDLVEFSPDAIWVNRNGRIDFVNSATVKLFGANNADEIIGKDFFDILHPDSHAIVRERIEKQRRGEKVPLAEEKIVRLDGTERYVETAAKIIASQPDLVIQVIMRDITKRKMAENALVEEQIRFSKLAATAPGVIYSFHFLNNQINLTYASPRIEDLFGFSQESLLSDASPILERVFARDKEVVMNSMMDSAKNLSPWHNLFRFEHPVKGLVWIEGRSMPVRENDGGTIWHGFVYDVTASRKTEEALRESEERFRGLYDNTTIGLYRTTPEGRIFMINPAGLQILGFNSAEEINRDILESGGYLPDYSHSEFRGMLEAHGYVHGLESSWRKKDGSIIFVRESAVSVKDKDGTLLYYDGSFEDITARKIAEEQAFRWLRVFNDSDLGLAIADVSTNSFLQVNPSFARQRGYAPEELAGQPNIMIFHPEERDKVLKHLMDIDRTGHGVFESVHLKKDGTRMPVIMDVTSIKDRKGKTVSRIAYSLDISERRLLQERESATLDLLKICNNASSFEELMKKLMTFFRKFTGFEAVGVRIKKGEDFPYYESRGFPEHFILLENHLCSYDHQNDIIRDDAGNPALDCMCGNIICGRFDPSKPFFTKNGSFWSPDTTRLLQTTSDADRQTKARNRCNGEGYETVVLIPLKMHGKPFGLFQLNDKRKNFITIEKVTLLEQFVDYVAIAMAKMQAEDEIRKLNEDLEQRVRERTQELESFTYSVSHDLRAPLRAIDGFTRILVDEYGSDLDNEGKSIATIIQDNTHKMGQLIDDLLRFSRLGRSEMFRSIVNSMDLIKECLEEIQMHVLCSEMIVINGPFPLIRADRAMMKQVWLNLLSNAIKFSSRNDTPKVIISFYKEAEQVVFAVKDNGVGFDMKYKNKLFGVFQRLHSQKEFDGTGVGLALVQRIISRHSGKVWAEAELGKGATFFFSLPL